MTSLLDLSGPGSRGWSWTRVKSVTSVLNRGTAPLYVDDGPVRVISQAANQPAGLDWNRTRFHDHVGDPKQLKGYLIAGDVLVNSTGTGTLGRVGYFAGGPDDLPCVADGHITVARVDRNLLDSRYLYYWLSSSLFRDYAYSCLTVGATNQIELSRERLAGAPIAHPSLAEQRRIADFLDAETNMLDQLVTLREAQSRLLADALYSEASRLTGRVFRGSGPDSGIRLPLRRIVEGVQTGLTPTDLLLPFSGDGMIPWYTPAALDGALGLSVPNKGVLPADSSVVPRFPAGGVLIVGIGESLGKVALLDVEATGNQQLACIEVQRSADRGFLAWQLHAANGEIRSWAQYSRIRILNNDNLLAFPVVVPSFGEQVAVRMELDCRQAEVEQFRAAAARFCALAAERRQALITAAVTGQIDVTTARGVQV